jgi:hypothetical protein
MVPSTAVILTAISHSVTYVVSRVALFPRSFICDSCVAHSLRPCTNFSNLITLHRMMSPDSTTRTEEAYVALICLV